MLTFILEPEVRTGNQVDNCARHPNFTWLCAALHTLSQMYSYARHVVAAAFDFTRVEACPNLEAQLLESLPNCAGALHSSCRAVEHGEDAVTGVLHQLSSVTAKLALDGAVVAFEEFLPRSIP